MFNRRGEEEQVFESYPDNDNNDNCYVESNYNTHSYKRALPSVTDPFNLSTNSNEHIFIEPSLNSSNVEAFKGKLYNILQEQQRSSSNSKCMYQEHPLSKYNRLQNELNDLIKYLADTNSCSSGTSSNSNDQKPSDSSLMSLLLQESMKLKETYELTIKGHEGFKSFENSSSLLHRKLDGAIESIASTHTAKSSTDDHKQVLQCQHTLSSLENRLFKLETLIGCSNNYQMSCNKPIPNDPFPVLVPSIPLIDSVNRIGKAMLLLQDNPVLVDVVRSKLDMLRYDLETVIKLHSSSNNSSTGSKSLQKAGDLLEKVDIIAAVSADIPVIHNRLRDLNAVANASTDYSNRLKLIKESIGNFHTIVLYYC